MQIYFNNNYCDIADAKVSILDRGYIFGDGLYEVFLVRNRCFIDFDAHITRLKRSMKLMNIESDKIEDITDITYKLLDLNKKDNALMYIQITRGALPIRDHNMPHVTEPQFVVIAYDEREYKKAWLTNGISCMLAEDIRWKRRDIKSLNLLGNVMLKQKAVDCGFHDVIFYNKDNMSVTEASSSNVILIQDEKLLTHPANQYILNGITKNRTISLAKDLNIEVIEREFTVDDLYQGSSVLLTNAGYKIRFCTSIDGKKIGNGKPCKLAKKMYSVLEDWVESCIKKS